MEIAGRCAAVVVLAAAAAAGCGGSKATAGPGADGAAGCGASADACAAGTGGAGGAGVAPNNSAVLAGVPVGAGTLPLTDVRRVVPAALLDGAGFQIGSATISHLSTIVDAGAYLIIPITNTTAGLRCYVAARDLIWLDGAGAVLRQGVSYVEGSVGATIPATSTATPSAGDNCLVPGESGYLLDVTSLAGVYGVVARVTVTLTAQDTGWELPGAVVLPTGYRIDNTPAVPTLRIDFRNSGSAAASVGMGYHRFVLLDGAGAPMHWTFANNGTTPTTDLLPGQTGSASYTVPDLYEGQATAMKAYIDFGLPSRTSSSSSRPLAPGGGDRLLALDREARDLRARQAVTAAAVEAAAAR